MRPFPSALALFLSSLALESTSAFAQTGSGAPPDLAAAPSPPYVFTKIPDVPFPDAGGTAAFDINDNGDIIGSWYGPAAPLPCDNMATAHAFLLTAAGFQSFDFTGPCWTLFNGINNEGQIVGSGVDLGGGGNKDFLFAGGQFTFLDVPGTFNYPGHVDINNHGKIVGNTGMSGSGFGYFIDQGVVSLFPVPGPVAGINDSDQIVGMTWECSPGGCDEFGCQDICTVVGYRRVDDKFETLAFPGAGWTTARGISNDGTIIGSYAAEAHPPDHGFILKNGQYSAFDFPGSTATDLFGINNRGEIVGVYSSPSEGHSFLARPALVANTLTELVSIHTSFDPAPVPSAPAGRYTIKAKFTNSSAESVHTPQFVVTELSNENLLLNADLPPGTVGGRLTPDAGPDGVLSPGESLNVTFVIGLQQRRTFSFFVDLLGVSHL